MVIEFVRRLHYCSQIHYAALGNRDEDNGLLRGKKVFASLSAVKPTNKSIFVRQGLSSATRTNTGYITQYYYQSKDVTN